VHCTQIMTRLHFPTSRRHALSLHAVCSEQPSPFVPGNIPRPKSKLSSSASPEQYIPILPKLRTSSKAIIILNRLTDQLGGGVRAFPLAEPESASVSSP